MPRRIRRNNNKIVRKINHIKNEEKFIYPKGKFDPPRIINCPKFQFVLDLALIQPEAGTANYTIANIVTAVRHQLGLPDTFTGFVIFVKRIDIWTLPAAVVGTGNTFAIRPYDIVNNVPHQWIEDQGTVARPGHLHAIWPVSQQNIALAVNSSQILFQVDSPATFTATLHFHLMVSFNTGDIIPTVRRKIYFSEFIPHPT